MPGYNLSQVIHVVDDDAQVRAATSYLLASHGYATAVYSSGTEFLIEAKLGQGCVLLDVRMPGLSGLDVLVELAKRRDFVPVVMLSGHADLAAAVQAMKLGAEDFVQKPYQEWELIAAIERALDSGVRLRNRSEAKASAQALLDRLSPRERQVLQGLLEGMTNKEIARHLELSPRTVEMHRANMMHDLGLTSLSHALRLAVDAELIPLESAVPGPPSAADRGLPQASSPPRDNSPDIAPMPDVLDVLEGTTDCAVLVDDNWKLTFLNANADATIGRGRNLVGSTIWEAFPQAVRTRAWEQLHRAAVDRHPVRFEFYAPDLEAWLDVNIRPVAGGMQLFFRDVTSERKANAALERGEETLRLALEASGHGAWDWNLTSGDFAMSPRFVNRLGYEPADLRDGIETFRQLIHPDDQAHLQEALDEHLQGRADSFSCEYRFRRRDGDWCWILNQGRIIASDMQNGVPTRMVGTAHDVTERKLEAALAEEAFERLALAQRNAGAGLWDLDLESNCVRLCAKSFEIHGRPVKESTELSEEEWQALVHPDDLPMVKRELERSIQTGNILSARYRANSSDRDRWILGLGKLVPEAAGRPSRFVGLNLDITDSMQTTLELKRVRSEMLHLSRLSAMDSMASTLAHELNQPLTAISNFVGGIRHSLNKRGGIARESIVAAIDGAEKSIAYAAEIVRRLRDHASGGAQEKKPERLRDIVDEACELYIGQFSDCEVPIRDISDDIYVLVDRIQIEQLLLNILRNAREAMVVSGLHGPITISAQLSGPFVEVHVQDCGRGVPEELKAALFSPLMSNKPHGTGIGLSICRTIVEAHEGRIWVEDSQPRGACFCFTLPLPR